MVVHVGIARDALDLITFPNGNLAVGIHIPSRASVVPGLTVACGKLGNLQHFAVFRIRNHFDLQIFGRNPVPAVNRDRLVAQPRVPAAGDLHEAIQDVLHRGEFTDRECRAAHGIRARQEGQ